MTTKILIMGLPGAGKTTFAQELVTRLMLRHTVQWFNADAVRKEYNDWDFSAEGRLRQVHRMCDLTNQSNADFVICDFVCPIQAYRDIFDADMSVWIDTIDSGRYADTNQIFEPPKNYSYRIKDWSTSTRVIDWIMDNLSRYEKKHIRLMQWRMLGTEFVLGLKRIL
jgi:adenylylsulfate kinase